MSPAAAHHMTGRITITIVEARLTKAAMRSPRQTKPFVFIMKMAKIYLSWNL
jgi:hypothetical protein